MCGLHFRIFPYSLLGEKAKSMPTPAVKAEAPARPTAAAEINGAGTKNAGKKEALDEALGLVRVHYSPRVDGRTGPRGLFCPYWLDVTFRAPRFAAFVDATGG